MAKCKNKIKLKFKLKNIENKMKVNKKEIWINFILIGKILFHYLDFGTDIYLIYETYISYSKYRDILSSKYSSVSVMVLFLCLERI